MEKMTNKKHRSGVFTPLLESIVKKMFAVVDTSMLTEQELTVLGMVLKGIPTADIADSLGLDYEKTRRLAEGAIIKIGKRPEPTVRTVIPEGYAALKEELEQTRKLLKEKNREIARKKVRIRTLEHEETAKENARLKKELLQLKETSKAKESSAEVPEGIAEKNLADFHLSVHTVNFCHKNGILTVGDLVGHSLADLTAVRGCGKRTIRELVTITENLDIKWK